MAWTRLKKTIRWTMRIPAEANTNLSLIADAAQQPVSVIHDFNPALLNTVAPAGYDLHVPKGTAQSAMAAIE